MTTMFNHNERNYAQNEKGNRFYMQGDDGKYIRVSQRAYEEAFAEFLEKTTEKIELEDDTNAIAEHTAEMAQEKTEEDAEDTQNTEASAPASGAKKTPKKAKKNTRKKKVQVGGFEFQEGEVHLILTPKQVDFLKHLSDSTFWQNGVQSTLWIDVLCDEIMGQFENKPMAVGAMISTLCEKGLGQRAAERKNGRKCTSFALTEMGKRVAKELGLE